MRLTRFVRALPALAFAVGALFSVGAHAGPITFTYDPGASSASFSDVSGDFFCLGCTPAVEVNQTPISFELENIGDSFLFEDFLTVSIDGLLGTGLAVGNGSATLEASIGFSAPSAGVSTIGSGDGDFSGGLDRIGFGFFSWYVYSQNGSITWSPTSQPNNLVFDDGTEISLAFSNASDSCSGIYGCVSSGGLSADVGVTSTLQAVPEPGSLALIGAGLIGFGAMRRRRNAAA